MFMTFSMFTAFSSSPKENPDQVNFDNVADDADNNFKSVYFHMT